MNTQPKTTIQYMQNEINGLKIEARYLREQIAQLQLAAIKNHKEDQ